MRLEGRAACETLGRTMGNPYLVTAYVFTIALLGLFGWSIASRKARARREIEALGRNQPPE